MVRLAGLLAAMAWTTCGAALAPAALPADSFRATPRQPVALKQRDRSLAPQQWALLPPVPKPSLAASSEFAPAAPDSSPVGLFKEAMAQIRRLYYGARPSDRDLGYAAVRGMLEALGDRYTRFLDPEEWRRMQEESGGEFGGVGIGIRASGRNEAEVASVTPGGAAQRAGIRIGDVLLRVNEQPLKPDRHVSTHAQDLVRGPAGTRVRLQLRRARSRRVYSVSLVRRRIQVPTVQYRMVSGGMGLVAVESFGKHTDEELAAALRKLQARGMRALILDLRGNPGGLFETAIEVASRFMPSGIVVYTQDRDGKRMHIPTVPNKRLNPPVPLAVLVDHGSASASEIVAGALQDSASGIVVGTTTYGKAVVQTITPLKDGSAILVTTHHYYTPRGTDIGSRGIEPDYAVAAAQVTGSQDPALRRALEVLGGHLATARRSAPRRVTRSRSASRSHSSAGLPS